MKFLLGMICGLVVAISVPFAFAMTATAAATGQGHPSPQKSTPLTHTIVETVGVE